MTLDTLKLIILILDRWNKNRQKDLQKYIYKLAMYTHYLINV